MQHEMTLEEANEILKSDWRLRLPLFRRRARQLLPFVVDNMGHWKTSMAPPPGKVERGYWRGVSEYALDQHKTFYPAEHKGRVGFAFPWLWLIGLLVQMVWKWWLSREQKWQP